MDWDLKLGRVMDEAGEASVERTARRRRTMAGGGGPAGGQAAVTCLVDGCTWDLSNCREYHRRHRVCERHSKTPVVLVSGEEQRFCQQCSRFHSLGEFDEAKRSCRKRLDGHNRRRRKTNPPESIYTNSSSPAATTTPPAPAPPPPSFLPPRPLFHPLIRHPPLPSSTSSWPVVGPSYPFLPPPQPSPSFGYLSRHSSNVIGRERGEVGHIDCALSLLSSSGTHQQQQQQQGFGGGVCSTSGSHGGAAHCYAFDDDDDDDVHSHGAPCRMFPFTWD